MSDVEHFRQAYAGGGSPPWDIGHPQPAMVEAGRRGWVRGHVLDAGCGTGEHALYFAAAGCDVVGVDVVPAAIARAEAKAVARASPRRHASSSPTCSRSPPPWPSVRSTRVSTWASSIL